MLKILERHANDIMFKFIKKQKLNFFITYCRVAVPLNITFNIEMVQECL